MARLNEPAMSTDSLETLRRKFLRQNREIARINSNQSQRIRELENDCARMLSENLELRSQVLHLENEIETGNTHRIADHALEVKAKLEAQLSIFSSLLEGLGTEPPRKRHSPSSRRVAKAKLSPSLASPARRLRIARDAEAMALQEGRLPAIPEYKPYPRESRATLNSEEIRALRGDPEPEDTTDSPDLGPPPVSRFVEDDPVKVDSPSPKPVPANLKSNNKEESAIPESGTSTPVVEPTRNATASRTAKEQRESVQTELDKAANSGTPAPAPQPLRAGAKRKFGGEENDGFRILKQTDKQSKESGATEKPRPVQDLQKRRSIKDISSGKREARDRTAAPDVPLLNPRKALAAKSTNDSPQKLSKAVGTNDSKPPKKPNDLGGDKAKQPPISAADKPNSRPPKKSPPLVQIPPSQPAPSAPTSTAIICEPETPIPEADLITPNTPDHRAAPATRDTPPPGMGDASRPSRRARPAISYAEPNLRDKMRRPTKELFDAVAGEGKFQGRNSMAPPGTAQKPSDDTGSAVRPSSSSKGKEILRIGEGMTAADLAVAKEASRRASILSPTPGASKDVGQKEVEEEQLPSSITTQRRNRGSSMGLSSMHDLVAGTTSTAPISFADKPQETVQAGDDGDVYDFESTSPVSKEKTDQAKPITVPPQARRSRASSSFQENGGGSLTSDAAPGIRYGGRGKRASMAAALTKLSMLELEDTEESSLEGEAVAKDRISRRRSMML
ncbi:hypothetical protein CONLIGDRAFT_435090 [Coniochaeta ligniaria NRRL 30616]|uniref:Shugoshin n=1 Tax=Coniochaeta ligniaria NRRL 30616 TaxID=1408157 RepID=A0A1J7IIG6_9PEZI|nr:hypothetical protein CONLIGDRAFT_435090 [Coniochaeta ligniaria NRRL 30616]